MSRRFRSIIFGGICKLEFFSDAESVFFFCFLNHVGIAKRENVGTFSEVCIYFEADGGAVSEKPKNLPVSIRNENAFRMKMKEVLQKAVREYEKEDAGADVSKKALSIIEEAYGCEQTGD